MSAMIDRAARAIKAKVPLGYGMTSAESVEYARAAIEAMMTPTPEMIEAGDLSGFKASVRTVSTDVWQAMIAAALTETQP